jgi:2,5-diamino-6-(ribosylamino)-4(3H)-pyrimidinone 5'-phosphate reductase
MNRPETTLFMLMSVDGKISTGDNDSMDVDSDFPKIAGLSAGLQQYYDLEQETDLFSLNTGRVFQKIGVNENTEEPTKLPVSFVVIDNEPHLNRNGVEYLAKKTERLIIATTNNNHPANALRETNANINVHVYDNEIDFLDLLSKLKTEHGAEKLTIQSGGTLNAHLVRAGLIDKVQIVVAPALIGGKETSTLMDGESLHSVSELNMIKTLELVSAKPLDNSYLLLEYKVIN